METKFTVPDDLKIQILDTGRHHYAKMDLQFLVDLNVCDWISDDSFLCYGHSPLNHFKSTFIECDTDFDYVARAIQYFNPNVNISFDHQTLTDLFEERYDDYRDWLEEDDDGDPNLEPFSTYCVFEVKGYRIENELSDEEYKKFEDYMNGEDED